MRSCARADIIDVAFGPVGLALRPAFVVVGQVALGLPLYVKALGRLGRRPSHGRTSRAEVASLVGGR